MAYAWLKLWCDFLRHPLFRKRPDCDIRLALGLMLHAKEHSPEDGCVRGLDVEEMRGLFGIKAPSARVNEGLEHLLRIGWLELADEHGTLRIKDFVARQARAGEFDDDGTRRARQVYFIRAEGSGRIKIGCSSNPWARLKTLQTASSEQLKLVAMQAGGEDEERELHDRFKQLRVNREWFEPGPDLLAHIATVAATRSATRNSRVAATVATNDETTVALPVATKVAATTRLRSRPEATKDDHRSKSGESEGRESTACESVDNPQAIPANLSESERSHVLTLFSDGKATEARDYLASLQGGRGIPIQKKSGSGGVS